MPPVIPSPDPAGLPAPAALIVFLSLLTFTLHLVAMNLLVGGSILQVVALRRAKADPFFGTLAKKLGAALPLTMSLTITLGVAPLLFVQLLYGQAFYTSTVLMAWPWLSIIALLMVSYYALYAVRFRPEWLSGGVSFLAAVAAVFVLIVGLLQVLNATLLLLPDRWATLYSSSALGLHLNLDDRTVAPRYLHFMVAGLAFGGLGVMLLARLARKTDHKWAERATAYGARWFLAATGVELLIGLWLLFSMPRPVVKAFIGGNPVDAGLLLVGILAALAAMPFAKRLPYLASALAVVAVAFMAIVRHRVRDLMLAPRLDVYAQQVNPQWALFATFAVILIAGLATVAWLVVQFVRSSAPRATKSA